jgi:AcrR family transcriptional regulator
MSKKMQKRFDKKQTASREDWLWAALDVLRERGIEGVKVVVLARTLGLTSGSFYWHFKNIQDLLDAVLDYWENTLTVYIIDEVTSFDGDPKERIFRLMRQVIYEDAAVPDGAIAVWAKSDAGASAAFRRTVKRRMEFAKWMFEQAGFEDADARVRGRLMVISLIGETANDLKSQPDWEDTLRDEWCLLTNTARA